jgi:maltooligosyltrehalose trehalohydrolase
MLFQGEEWGATTPFQYFTDHRDAALGRAVSEGRRSEFRHFGWDPSAVPDPQDPATFERSKLDWDEAQGSDLLEWYRALIALRRSRADLIDGRADRVSVDVDEAASHLVYRRGGVTVECDLARDAVRVCADGELLLEFG